MPVLSATPTRAAAVNAVLRGGSARTLEEVGPTEVMVMERRRTRGGAAIAIAVAIALLLALLMSAAAPALAAPPAAASNRAGVVVDEGNGTVKRVGITFTGTITGIAALQLAGFDPTVRSFGGVGGGVCALDIGGTKYGCPNNGTCLTCAAPDYWSYSRAPAGSTSFTWSRAGAGATQVHDGDMEGWRWGTGDTPTYEALDKFFPPPTTTTVAAPPTTAPHVTTTVPTRGRPGVHGQGTTGPDATTTSAPSPAATRSGSTTTNAASTTTATAAPHGGAASTRTTTTGPPPGARAGPGSGTGRLASGPPIVHDPSATSPAVWIVFAAIIAAFTAAIAIARRRRAHAVID